MAEVKVTGKVVAIQENPEVQERIRLKIEELKQKNPKKYEEHKETFARLAEKLVKKDLEFEENQRKQDEALYARMRKKLNQEFYKQLGIDEDYIEKHRDQIEKWERMVGKPQTVGDELDAAANVAGGAVGNVTEGRSKIGKHFGNLASLGFEQLLKAIDASKNAISLICPPIGMIISAVSVVSDIAKIIEESKKQNGRKSDAAEKVEAYKKKLEEFANQLKTLEEKVVQDKDKLVEAAKTMKKAELNEFIKNYVSEALAEFGLSGGGIAEEIQSEVEQDTQGQVQEESTTEPKTTEPKTEEEKKLEEKKKQEEQAAQGGLS